MFTAPLLAGIGAAAVSIPVIIHLMSRFRRRPEAWGAMRFLIEAYQKQRKRLQVEKLLLLLVRCGVVLLAGLALAGPVLPGCSKGGFALTPSGGRVVYLVIDDALTSQTREAGTTRLEQHKQQALAIIDEMKPGDRAVIVRMARPATQVLSGPTSDTAALRQAVEKIQPRFSRGELVASLMLVNQSIEAEDADDRFVVLLSDFPASADYFNQPVPPELEGLGERASIVTALPPAGTDNLQVRALTPHRRMVVAEPAGATVVGGRVLLRRFGAIAQRRVVDLGVSVSDADGRRLASTRRVVTWPAGEREQAVNFDLPVQLPSDAVAGVGRELVVRAELLPGTESAGVDVLAGDDAAVAVVRVRDRLQVALVDDEQGVEPEPGAFMPGQWVGAALTPQGPGAVGAFELSPLLPTSLNGDVLEAFDAAVVLRPDELTTRGWQALNAFAEGGGLVWVFAPALQTEADWAQTMARIFEVPWSFGDALVSDEDEQGAPKPAAVDATTAPPDVLQFLAADWREKLGWVSVTRRLPLSAPEEDRWIVLEGAADNGVIMAGRGTGQGALVVFASALDTRFTNLPVRALFVPLVHDTLRGVLGASAGEPAVVAGDGPALGRSWRGVGALDLLGAGDPVQDTPSLFVLGEGAAARLREPAAVPGVYRGTLAGSPRLLAVNADSDAGDTVGGRAQLELLLDGLGGWAYLSDRRAAGGVLAVQQQGADLTRALLWALLVLVLLETLLARWFSHATDRDRPTVVGRVLGALHGDAAPRGAGGGV